MKRIGKQIGKRYNESVGNSMKPLIDTAKQWKVRRTGE